MKTTFTLKLIAIIAGLFIATRLSAQGQQAIEYFENEGQELTIQKDNNSAKAVINVTENGFYTVYAKDDAGNATIEVFEVTTITEDPET